MGVRFLTVHSSRGTVTVEGPVTGLPYHISKFGTPVNEYDVPDLLAMVADPCCGPALPFEGKVRLFGVTAGSRAQRASVPAEVLCAEPMTPEPKPPVKRGRKRPVVVEVEEDRVVPVEEEVEPAEKSFVPEKLEDLSKNEKD